MDNELFGKVLNDSSIAVDCFDEAIENGIYFLTEGTLKIPLPPHVDRVYTSPYNARLLQTKYQISPDMIVALDMNKKMLIQDSIKKLNFYVTLMDAKQKPGAVMFLFEDDSFGNILYAGKCCYSEDFFNRPLCSFLKTKILDYLYIHDACDDCHIHSKSVGSAVEDICDIARMNSNCKIFIIEPYLREDILMCLKDKLKSSISVTENIMKHLEDVGKGSDFTLSYKGVQVLVADNPLEKWRVHNAPVIKIILVPCSSKLSSKNACVKLKKLKEKGYFVILYRNHCSRPELQSLVRDLNATFTVPIRPQNRQSIFTKPLDLDYWSHLGNIDKCFTTFEEIFYSTEKTELQVNVEPITCLEKKAQWYDVDDLDTPDSSADLKLEDVFPKECQLEGSSNWYDSDSEETMG